MVQVLKNNTQGVFRVIKMLLTPLHRGQLPFLCLIWRTEKGIKLRSVTNSSDRDFSFPYVNLDLFVLFG